MEVRVATGASRSSRVSGAPLCETQAVRFTDGVGSSAAHRTVRGTCLITAPSPAAIWTTCNLSWRCTAACTTDADCVSSLVPSSKCRKLVCAVPSVVPGKENFCCQKLCMCEDDLIPGLNRDGSGPGWSAMIRACPSRSMPAAQCVHVLSM